MGRCARVLSGLVGCVELSEIDCLGSIPGGQAAGGLVRIYPASANPPDGFPTNSRGKTTTFQKQLSLLRESINFPKQGQFLNTFRDSGPNLRE